MGMSVFQIPRYFLYSWFTHTFFNQLISMVELGIALIALISLGNRQKLQNFLTFSPISNRIETTNNNPN